MRYLIFSLFIDVYEMLKYWIICWILLQYFILRWVNVLISIWMQILSESLTGEGYYWTIKELIWSSITQCFATLAKNKTHHDLCCWGQYLGASALEEVTFITMAALCVLMWCIRIALMADRDYSFWVHKLQ